MITKEMVDPLVKEYEKLDGDMIKLHKAIIALQALCAHDDECVGHDSHKNHYKCKICGKEYSI